MGQTLVILAHPKIEESIGNKIISTNLAAVENTEIRHLDKLYPDFKFDIKAEQQALLNADTIIFQFPLFWYNVPGILKEWIDQVFLYGFAFGKDNYNLKGKKVIVSFTIGSSLQDYPEEIIDKITFPLRGLASYCKMEYVSELFCNDIHNHTDEAKNAAIEIAETHSQKLVDLIKN